MKKHFILMLVLVVWAAYLPAQITRGQADTIVEEHLQNEIKK